MKRLICILLISALLMPVFVYADDTVPFNDVPKNHFAYQAISDMRLLGITNGVDKYNNFGMGRTITRGEFITFLIKLTRWDMIKPPQGSFTDNLDSSRYYYGPIETALAKGVIVKDASLFRVNDPVTREEMAVMIVRALGYDSLARQCSGLNSFSDVQVNQGYMTLAKDFGIMSGTGGSTFSPGITAKREEAAYMLMKMHARLNGKLEKLHAFYAISSNSQIDLIASLDSVSFGWSRLEYDAAASQVKLNTTYGAGNEYGFPQSFSETLRRATDNGIPAQLMVAVKNDRVQDPATGASLSLGEYIVTRPEVRSMVIQSIAAQVNASVSNGSTVSFNGVVIDIEDLRGTVAREAFNEFLKEMKAALVPNGKLLYVAVQPARKPGQAYYDGYDFKTIGEVADKVILMAHDYYAKQLTDNDMAAGYTLTPLTPQDEVYYALKMITDKTTGVQDRSKIWLQISFDAAQWKKKDGAVLNRTPYQPGYAAIQSRLVKEGVTVQYSESLQNPYAAYTDQDGTENIIWYEDSRSVEAKIRLASMFGIGGLSIWRLGNIPAYEETEPKLYLDTWKSILDHMKTE